MRGGEWFFRKCLAGFLSNFTGLVISIFSAMSSLSLDFFCKAKKVSGSQKIC